MRHSGIFLFVTSGRNEIVGSASVRHPSTALPVVETSLIINCSTTYSEVRRVIHFLARVTSAIRILNVLSIRAWLRPTYVSSVCMGTGAVDRGGGGSPQGHSKMAVFVRSTRVRLSSAYSSATEHRNSSQESGR